ncbi:MspA family porin [Gordonia sp. NPDC003585]|uniref:MspA family porin n=1 Tax=unclassified Gordonia (in: high G+C Gram-positive bacteria) TaxID=2657482 RepID=UPI0033ADC14F
MKKNITRRVVAGAAITGAAVMGIAGLGDAPAHAGKLPGGTITKTLADGTKVTVTLFDQYANYQRAVTNVQTSREVWVTGKVRVTINGKQADGGSIKVGYDVGCQVSFTAEGGGFGGADVDPANGNVAPNGDTGVNGTVKLGPGQVGTVWVINTTSGDSTAYKDYEVNDYTFKGNKGGVVYSQEKFGVDGCAGYAAARPRIQVTVSTDSVKSITVLNGKPFSLG